MLEHCEKHYVSHWKATGVQDRVTYQASLNFARTDGDMILIYDADYFIIKDAEKIDALLGGVMSIGFQEKLDVELDADIQRQMFHYLHFKAYTFEPPNAR